MKKIIIAGLWICIASFIFAADAPQDWSVLEHKIRDAQISKDEALLQMKCLRVQLDQFYTDSGCELQSYTAVFPVAGYKLYDADVRGYKVRGYDFFDFKKHGDHPAVDIFIVDKNKDCLDDRNKKAIKVISVSPGIVLSINSDWTIDSKIRGGNYVWVYDPVSTGLFYFAHLDKVYVQVGQIVKQGDVLGTVGRTGKNAYPKRSPTHLHLMYLKYPKDGYPKPQNVSKFLFAAKAHKKIEVEKLEK